MTRKTPLSLLVALATASLGMSALAQDQVALDDMVVTGTRSASPLLEQAGNTGRVSQDEIDLVRADHVTDIVNRVTGVMVQRGYGQEHLTAIRSPVLQAGAGAGSFLYLEDGVPLRAAGFANINGLFEVNHEQAGGIEIVRGPGSAFYGSNAVHGLINVLTRAPSLDLERQIDVSAGPHDLYKFKGTVSDTVGRHGYRASVYGATDGGYVSDSGYDQQKVSLRHDYFGELDSFKTVFSYVNLNQETAGYAQYPDGRKGAYRDESFSRTNPVPEAYRDARAYRLSTEWERLLSDSSSLRLTPYVRYTEMDFLMHFLNGQPVEKNKHSSIGLLAAYTHDLDGGHRIIVGTDLEYTEGDLSEIQYAPSQGQFVQGLHYDYDVDATVIAPYIHSEWQLLDRTRLVAGLRYERTEYDYSNKAGSETIPGNTRYFRPDSRKDTFNNLSPKLGLVQALNEDTSAFINYSRGNRAPQTTDLYRALQNQGGEADSEKVDSFEVGVRKLGEGLQYEVATYYMKKRDYFFRDVNNDNVPNGKTEHYGIELGLFYPFSEQWDIGANMSYARHRFDFDYVGDEAFGGFQTEIKKGNDMMAAPRRMANVRLGWNFRPQSRAELEWIHMGKYYLEESNQHSYSGHDLINLRVSHALNQNLTVYGRIHNLFNTDYAERADYNRGSYRYFVGEKRYLHVGASYSF